MIQVGALWLKENSNGKFLSGNLGGKNCRLLVFPNKYKEKDNQPDYVVFLDGMRKKDDGYENRGSDATGIDESDMI